MRRCLMKISMILPLVLASVPALAQASTDRPDYWHHGGGWGWDHMIPGAFMMILFWGGLIAVIFLAIRWFGGRSSQGATETASGSNALEILEERFARGEIDKEEFEERKRVLNV